MISLFKNIKLLFCDKAEREFFVFVRHQLGFSPNNILYYKKALTHKSAYKKDEKGHLFCNERLEFLGDSVLDSVIADYLFKKYPESDEGFLTKMRSKIANRKSLNQLGLNIKLDKYIITNNLYVVNNNAIGNALEALIGAIYLDKGYNFTQNYIIDKLLERFLDFNYLERVDTNFKSRLIEVIQRNKGIVFFETAETPHEERNNLVFNAIVSINESRFCEATGRTKKEAEQNASRIALQMLKEINA